MLEIDGIRDSLESSRTEAGDYISDEYWKAIDLSTSPNWDNPNEVQLLTSAIRRLNRNLASTEEHLVHDGLVEVYNHTVTQLNDMNSHVERLFIIEPANTRELVASGSFQWL